MTEAAGPVIPCIDVHSHFFPREVLDVLRREGARYLYLDSLTHSPGALGLFLETVGPERVMWGSDFPFDMGSPTPRAVVEAQAALTAEDRERIYRDTAVEFLGLGDRRP